MYNPLIPKFFIKIGVEKLPDKILGLPPENWGRITNSGRNVGILG
jgi:hypothetical protein